MASEATHGAAGEPGAPANAGYALGPVAIAAGFRLAAYDELGSTNAEAMERARNGDPGDLWVVTRRQTAGRGRRGRAWVAPPGNLSASLLKVIELPPACGATLGFVAGLALDAALERLAPNLSVDMALDGAEGPGEGARRDRLLLKWPNDLMLDGGKLAGILLEAENLGGGRTAIVIGIGVNVAHEPEGVPYKATSLASCGIGIDAEMLFAALGESWVEAERVWDAGRGFPAVRQAWLRRAKGLGGRVAVRLGDKVIDGFFETLDDDGRLLVRAADGSLKQIAAGDVHFGVAATAV
ncbi:BirA family transcriptional regulator, biotin operon repressor / biotin-[acetyl-CoA-carboxylase] ligase [Pseudoxanthobacter soli DSM 19599]|uniref:biotin--[biotin carboxyl-carrier protein] ligase n=1 Tax=Pseudoxanthobacter soli DSM 19599 TaxID=1123029 RepID=A0A1M7ZMQ6_9HYPH|nr:biotin--[acetyl-CoA-carboxylase] ligase [Pseudoxanthobacter soli]SHO66180.1 BirA family transcriptional regulator, biotin operon repressor / biotin-[acetyl-CoA-carboxylase] ligase [Pseudoxanthobacter soli DSM 19599]